MQTEKLIRNVEKLCKERGESMSAACKAAGLSDNFITVIKNKGVDPGMSKVVKLAQYLGCTVSDLLGEEQKKQPAPEGDELRERIDALNQQEREEALRFLDYLRAKREMP